jgi:4-hydroxymandelate synthase
MSNPTPFENMKLDHVRLSVKSIDATREWLSGGYGLTERTGPDVPAGGGRSSTVELGVNDVRFLVTEAVADHPSAKFVRRHGDGVSDIAFRVADAVAAFDEAVQRGARPVSAPVRDGATVTAVVGGFGDLVHTLIERPESTRTGSAGLLQLIDHFAVVVGPGDMDSTVAFYRYVFDFDLTFGERLQIGEQAMVTKVVQSRSKTVTFTLIEPDVTQKPGHIDDFLDDHGCAGVQHIAFATDDIVRAVDVIRGRGVEFMSTPDSYYEELPNRVVPEQYGFDTLREHRILVDEDHDGQLFQIFTKSVHPRNTLFLELIEREGAQSFGSGNITALYEAAERERRGGTSSRAA